MKLLIQWRTSFRTNSSFQKGLIHSKRPLLKPEIADNVSKDGFLYRLQYYDLTVGVHLIFALVAIMGPRKQKVVKEEQVTLGPQVAEGENVFGVAHIFASFNDTFVHVTDLSGK